MARTEEIELRDDESPSLGERGRRLLPRGAAIVLVLAVAVLAMAAAANLVAGAVDRLNPFRNGIVRQENVDRSGPAVLKAVNDLGEFRAASGYYEVVVDLEKDVKGLPSFIAGERVVFVAAGTVDVAVEFGDLGAGAVAVDEQRTTATIRLPAPRLTPPRLDVQRSYIANQQRGAVDRLRDAVSGNPAEQKELYTLADRRLAAAAAQSPELGTRAEANTRAALTSLLTSLGFTNVVVIFDPAD